MQPREPTPTEIIAPEAIDAPSRETANPVASRHGSRVRAFILTELQLTLITTVIWTFRIEGTLGFPHLMPMILVGYATHFWASSRLKPIIFSLLAFALLLLHLGPPAGITTIVIGLVFVGISQLPMSSLAQNFVLVVAASLLAYLRHLQLWPWFPMTITAVASMFMFRLIIYTYDRHHSSESVSIWQQIAYFFNPMNVPFPLFPVIDYSAFVSRYQAHISGELQQRGILWIVKGIVHLLLYRVIYTYYTIDPLAVQRPVDLLPFIFSSFLLYVRVSGLFHVCVGVLHLFGYALTPTHNRYFLSSSYGDVWNRTNIYWKDFMQKIFFFPAFVFMRHRIGTTPAMILATIWVFFWTWFLHIYQMFWIQNAIVVSITDALFWTTLCLLLLGNMFWNLRFPNKGSMTGPPSWKKATAKVCRVFLVYVTMSLLWSLWNSPNLAEWYTAVSVLQFLSLRQLGVMSCGIGILLMSGTLIVLLAPRMRHISDRYRLRLQRMSSISVIFILLLMQLMVSPAVTSRLIDPVAAILLSVRDLKTTPRDDVRKIRGYYEKAFASTSINSPLWDLQIAHQGDGLTLRESGATRATQDIFRIELVPSKVSLVHNVPLSTNAWGLRDREYTIEKKPQTYRIAVVGASYVMGSGVRDSDVFDEVLEGLLNQQYEGLLSIEVLNFGISNTSLLQHLAIIEDKVLRFEPDVVIYFTHYPETRQLIQDLAENSSAVIKRYPEIKDLIGTFDGVDANSNIPEDILAPHGSALTEWAYRRIVAVCKKAGVQPIWCFWPRTDSGQKRNRVLVFENAAKTLGLKTINLVNVYQGYSREEIQLSPSNEHPTAFGHKLVAQALREELARLGIPQEH